MKKTSAIFMRFPKHIVYLITLFAIFSGTIYSQSFPVGHRTMNFTDVSRNNRQVTTEVYYPATIAGENTATAPGQFPVIVFGHGFQMGYDSYTYLKNAMVPDGYLVVFATTETSLAPSHAEFGADLAFLVVQMKAEGSNPASPFYNHVDSTSAIMGHALGGGASFLGCKNNTTPTVMVTWAAAETNPSAISAARLVTIPALVFSADKDCVTPPASNQVPMYDSLASSCKVFINIKGGGHCYFADANFICSLGEVGCPPFAITREQQHSATLDFTRMYLAKYLKGDATAWIAFNDSLAVSPRITYKKSCTTTSIDPGQTGPMPRIIPNPVTGTAMLDGLPSYENVASLRLFDCFGKELQVAGCRLNSAGKVVLPDISGWPAGIYLASVVTQTRSFSIRFVKVTAQ